MGGRVVEGSGLENRQGLAPLVGSNPTPSASILVKLLIYLHFIDYNNEAIAVLELT
jgi:hypothetical protein